jgi:N-methylhydantoinase A
VTDLLNVIAVDVGGTHTDAVLLASGGDLFVSKVKSTPSQPERAFVAAVEELLELSGLAIDQVAAIVHGTTVATNAIITGKLGRVGLLTTAGFRDVLDIGNQQRASLYDPWTPKRPPIVPRERRREVIERVGANGDVITPLDLAGVEESIAEFDGNVDAVAVSLLFSFVNDQHERQISEFLAQRLPGLPVSLSSRVSPECREYPRTSTTALNAALLPETGGYLRQLERRLRDRGFHGAFQIMLSGGGVVPASTAQSSPVSLLVSGPAAGAVGAAHLGREAGFADLVMLDVGGTSADVALITDGSPRRTYQSEVEGWPVTIPQIDVLPIGAGGGSIARVDDFGSLSVGPESAGADPGPAAYGVGEEPTLTDAYLVLGSLDPQRFLGGRLRLDLDRARRAIREKVAAPLHMDEHEAAAAIIRIANGKMAGAIRMVTVGRGFDVRECALTVFGGAGPLHACSIADELGVTSVVVPRYPGLTSALGLVVSDGRYDISRTFIARTATLDLATLTTRMEQMTREAKEFLREAGAESEGRVEVDLDMRYVGQAYELTIAAGGPEIGIEGIARAEKALHQAHLNAYGHSWEDRPVEIVTIRLRAVIPRTAPKWQAPHPDAAVDPRARDGWTPDGTAVRYQVLDRTAATVGLRGPAILEQADSTVLVEPGWEITRNEGFGLVLERIDAR